MTPRPRRRRRNRQTHRQRFGVSQAEHWEANVSMPDDEAWEGDDIREDGPPTVAKPYEGTGSI
jgi:hypothetical protein